MSRKTSQPFKSCRVDGCTKKQRSSYSPYCETHARKKKRTGHPLGQSLPSSVLTPVIKEATDYIAKNQNAPAIQAGLNWCESWLQSGYSTGDNWRDKTPLQIVNHLIHRIQMKGVDPIKLLATLSAYQYLNSFQPGTFFNDDHFRYQWVKAVLTLAPLPVIKRVTVSGYKERNVYLELSPKIISAGFDTIRIDALLLSFKIAEKLHEADHWRRVLGQMHWPIPKITTEKEALSKP